MVPLSLLRFCSEMVMGNPQATLPLTECRVTLASSWGNALSVTEPDTLLSTAVPFLSSASIVPSMDPDTVCTFTESPAEVNST